MASKTADKIKAGRPDVGEEVLALADELDEKHALAAVADSDGGKLLLNTLLIEVRDVVDKLVGTYKAGTHTDLVVLCARLDSNLAIYRALKRAPKNKKILDEALKDALSE
jgi:hypothetical protein